MSVFRIPLMAIAMVGLITGLAAAQAQPPKPTTQPAATAAVRIAFINAGALLKGMPGYQQAESTFAKEAEAAQAEAQKIRAGFDSAVATFQQSQAMMTPSNRTAREKVLAAQQDTVQSKLQAIQNRIGLRERELLAPMQDRLKSIIDGVRAEGNYAMIIDLGSETSANIVSYDKSLDITLRVAQRLAQPTN
jgi:Skp family chaperone for outer membrane proteins